MNEIVKKVVKTIKIKYLLDEISNDIDEFLDKGLNIDICEDSLTISSINTFLQLSVNNNDIFFIKKVNNETKKIKYAEKENIIYIKYVITKLNKMDCEFVYSCDHIYNEIFRIFNKDGLELFRRESKKIKNYYEDKITKETVLKEPNVFENYVENNYFWRKLDNIVINKYTKKYMHSPNISLPNDFESTLIRYENLKENDFEIPDNGKYNELSEKMFNTYIKSSSFTI